MPNLVIVDLTPINKKKLTEYSQQAAKTLIPFNGHFIAKGPIEILNPEKLTENSDYTMKAVIEFPDKKSAQDWYNSKEYQAIIPLRKQGMKSQFHLV